VRLLDGCASETVRLLKEAGVVMTPAGATWPYGKDPSDSNIRIAPTYPPADELETAMRLFCAAAELVCAQKLLSLRS
jgi:DNA-binding transcriptional MocR family regulator